MSESEGDGAAVATASASEDASATRAPGARRAWIVPAIAALVAAVLGGAIGGYVTSSSAPSDGALAERVAALEDKSAALSAQADRDAQLIGALQTAIAQGAEGGAAGAALEALTLRLSDVEKGLASLESRMGGGSAVAPNEAGDLDAMTTLANRVMAELTVLKPQIETLGREIAAVKEAMPPASLSEDMAALAERIATLEAVDAEGLARRAASALALLSVAQTAQRGDAFGAELETLRTVVPSDPAIAVLAPYAASGVPDLEALKGRFRALIPLVLHAEAAADDRDWFDRLWTNALSLVTIRETGAQEGPSAEAILARAELKLAESDLAGAVGEMKTLGAAARARAAPWIADAEARVALNDVLRDLTARLIAHLAAGPAQ